MEFLRLLVPGGNGGDLRRLLQAVDCTLSALEVSTLAINTGG